MSWIIVERTNSGAEHHIDDCISIWSWEQMKVKLLLRIIVLHCKIYTYVYIHIFFWQFFAIYHFRLEVNCGSAHYMTLLVVSYCSTVQIGWEREKKNLELSCERNSDHRNKLSSNRVIIIIVYFASYYWLILLDDARCTSQLPTRFIFPTRKCLFDNWMREISRAIIERCTYRIYFDDYYEWIDITRHQMKPNRTGQWSCQSMVWYFLFIRWMNEFFGYAILV